MTEKTRYEFKTIADLHEVPIEKIPALCEDLRLWLSIIKIAEESKTKVKNKDTFGWIDDNRHDVTVSVDFKIQKENKQ